MKKFNDAEIQSLLENKNAPHIPKLNIAEMEEYKIYEQLFSIISEKPKMAVSIDFSKKVRASIESDQNKTANLLFCSLIGVLIFSGIAFLLNTGLIQGLQIAFFEFKWAILFSIFVFFTIQYFDKKLVRNFD